MTKDKRVSVEDFVNIQNLMGEYQFLVDSGDDEGWTSLFVEDGFFAGLMPEPIVGREALKMITQSAAQYKGKLRHMTSNFHMRYGETSDEAFAKFYSFVTTWVKGEGPKMFQMAVCEAHLLRVDGDWMVKSNTMQGLNEDLQF